MNLRRFLPVALFLATSVSAQELSHVHNLAPDSLGVNPEEVRATLASLSPTDSERTALNLRVIPERARSSSSRAQTWPE